MILDNISLQGNINLAGISYSWFYGRYKHFVPNCDYALVVTNGNESYVLPVHNRNKDKIDTIVEIFIKELISNEERAGSRKVFMSAGA